MWTWWRCWSHSRTPAPRRTTARTQVAKDREWARAADYWAKLIDPDRLECCCVVCASGSIRFWLCGSRRASADFCGEKREKKEISWCGNSRNWTFANHDNQGKLLVYIGTPGTKPDLKDRDARLIRLHGVEGDGLLDAENGRAREVRQSCSLTFGSACCE